VEILAPLDVPPGCPTSQAEGMWDGRGRPRRLMAQGWVPASTMEVEDDDGGPAGPPMSPVEQAGPLVSRVPRVVRTPPLLGAPLTYFVL